MRGRYLMPFVIWVLLSQAESGCDYSGALDPEDTQFADLFQQSQDGYQLNVVYSSKNERESVFISEYYNIVDKRGRVEIYRNGDVKEFVYFQDTDEAFTIQGYVCETGPLLSAPPFLEVGPREWLDYEDDVTLLGPSATLRKGFLAWKEDKSKVVYLGDIEDDRGIKMDKWKQCIGDATAFYYFSKPTWNNANDFPGLRIPIRFQYILGDKEQILEFYNYQHYLSDLELTNNVPEGYGCNRTAKLEDVPEMRKTNHLFSGEMVFHSIDREAKKISNFISTFEVAYHYTSDMLAYKYAPWKKVAAKEETMKTLPLTRTVWDNRNGILYSMNLDKRECTPIRDTEYYPAFELPGENDGNIDLLDENILTSTEGFKYLGVRKERGIPVKVFEKVVNPMFLGDRESPVGVVTRMYARDNAMINTGFVEKESPIRMTIKWFQDEERTKILGYLAINIYSYSNDIPNVLDYFDVGMCFRDYDASSWVKMIFPNMGVTRDALQAHTPQIQNEFLNTLLSSSETTPTRVQRILVDVNDVDFSVEALILERPTYQLDFNASGNFEIADWDENYGMVNKDQCLQKCVDYGKDSGETCNVVSFCGATCYISKDKNAVLIDNDQCILNTRTLVAQSLPSMDDLIRSIRKLVVTDQFALSFEINAGDTVKLVTFRAGSFGDSFGDTRGRLIPRLFREGRFKVSFPGMKLNKGDKETSRPSARFSFQSCLQACLNDPYCETVSYCRGTECVLSESYIIEELDRTVRNTKCTVLARSYVQSYDQFPGVTLTKTARDVVSAPTDDACARACTKESNFECRSFDFCEAEKECLLHSTHYFQLKDDKEGTKVKDNCTHYSKKYVYDFKKIAGRRAVGNAELTLSYNSVEECAKECVENGGFACTAFDYCESLESLDNKCFLLSKAPADIQTVERTDCSHYRNEGVKALKSPGDDKKYSSGLAGGLGFLFFLIGGAIGVGATYFIAFKYVNRR